MPINSRRNRTALALAAAAMITIPQTSFATNGMNMEGYGPVSTGMGGASMAYDTGVSAAMGNPATIGLMKDGDSKLEIGVGNLRPAIDSESMASGTNAKETSSGDSFILPVLGWTKKAGKLSYGVGVFSQGGMGTEYDNAKFMTTNHTFYPTPDPFSGQTVRSEVGVGRLVLPLAYEATNDLVVGGSLDLVWAGMDIQMDLSGLQFADLVGPGFGGINQFGRVSGSLINTFGAVVAPNLDPDGQVNWGRVDFSDGSDFTGSAGGTGFAGKLGGVYKISRTLRLGASYQSKTSLSDLKSSDATLTFSVNFDDNMGGGPNGTVGPTQEVPLKGKVKVKDFQWPEIISLGVAYEATSDLMLVADYKRINWSKVMKDFSMTFTADAGQAGLASAFDGNELDMTLFQDWEDQNVLLLGAGYKLNDDYTIRGGLNLANNPVPSEYMNPLFPAIIKNHVTAGLGYKMSKASTLDFSLVYAPPVKQKTNYGEVTNGNLPSTVGDKVEVTHAQTNWQFIYSYLF